MGHGVEVGGGGERRRMKGSGQYIKLKEKGKKPTELRMSLLLIH